jgi:hypothetical protein
MRGAIVTAIKVAGISMALFIVFTWRASGQDRFDNVCPSLQNASPPDLLQFLTGVTPDEKNAWCVTWAIHKLGLEPWATQKLGPEHYETAIAVLVKLLDFRRPLTPDEKMGYYLRPMGIDELYPAAEALEVIGEKALPEVLRAIEADSTSPTGRDNAVAVWMEGYKYERPKGVALLKQEETKTNNDTIKKKLRWAGQKALTYCGPPQEKEGAACRQAAATAIP